MRIVDDILAPAREQELVCKTHIKHIDLLHRITERFGKHDGSSEGMQEILRNLALERNSSTAP